ncbi:MAG: P-type DNA transfer ATPase VirB11 [Acetobacteraceae bacterium]|nr:P-type DNA transfer ATPase VirB11 [Acetobacteraceae bacterium]
MSEASYILNHLMRPIRSVVDEGAVEVAVNRPHEVWVRVRGRWQRFEVRLPFEECRDLAQMVGSLFEQDVGAACPLVGAELPDGSRAQAVVPPCVRDGTVSLTIRKHRPTVAPVEDIPKRYDTSRWNKWQGRHARQSERDRRLLACYDRGDIVEFVRQVARLRVNCVLCGVTGSGKTTAANTLLSCADPEERVVTIENAFELLIGHPNAVRLLYSHGGQGAAQVSQSDLLQACLRMNPNRIVAGEIRDPLAAWSYLEGAGTGHGGNVTTIHGGSAQQGAQRLFDLARSSPAGAGATREMVARMVEHAADVIIPFEENEGVYSIGEVWVRADAERRGKSIFELLF